MIVLHNSSLGHECLSEDEIMLHCYAVWWHEEMHFAITSDPVGLDSLAECKKVCMSRENKISAYDACGRTNLRVWFVPTICCKRMHVPGCTFTRALSMRFTTPGLLNRVGSASFIPVHPFTLQREKPYSLSWKKKLRWHDRVGRHWDSFEWLTHLVALS